MNVTSVHRFDHRLKFVEQIVLATIFIAALIGNSIVLVIILKKRIRRMRFFILHLTIADLLVAFFSVLPMLIWKSTTTFFGGNFLCRIIPFLMLTVSYISVYTLVVMAYDRYQAIVHPLSSYDWTTRRGLSHMFGVWCLSLLLATPQLFIFRLAHHPSHGKQTCVAEFFGSDRTWELIYIVWTILVQFLLPVILLIYSYSSVYLIVNKNLSMQSKSKHLKMVTLPNSTQPTSSSNPFPRDLSTLALLEKSNSRQFYVTNHFLSRARLKTIKFTFVVVVTYILCSTPFYIGSIIMALHGKFISQKTMNWLMTIFSLLFNLNSCSNPIICLILSGSTPRELRRRNLGERGQKTRETSRKLFPM